MLRRTRGPCRGTCHSVRRRRFDPWLSNSTVHQRQGIRSQCASRTVRSGRWTNIILSRRVRCAQIRVHERSNEREQAISRSMSQRVAARRGVTCPVQNTYPSGPAIWTVGALENCPRGRWIEGRGCVVEEMLIGEVPFGPPTGFLVRIAGRTTVILGTHFTGQSRGRVGQAAQEQFLTLYGIRLGRSCK